jgi:hypothetical protein
MILVVAVSEEQVHSEPLQAARHLRDVLLGASVVPPEAESPRCVGTFALASAAWVTWRSATGRFPVPVSCERGEFGVVLVRKWRVHRSMRTFLP